MALRGILFDKDGTLLDFEATWTPVLRELALEAAGGDVETAMGLLVRGGFLPETGGFRAGSVLAAGTSRSIVELWQPDLRDEEFAAAVARMDRTFHQHGLDHSVPFAEVAATLERLAAADFVMGVATNDTTAAARASLAALGFASYLPHVFGYDAVPQPKPAPDLVHAFADVTGIPPAEIAVVGDNSHDLEMARAAGAGVAVGVLSGTSDHEHLAPLADVVLDSIRDLPDWLHQNRK